MTPDPLAALGEFLERAKHVSVVVAASVVDDEALTIQRLNLHEDVSSEFLEAARSTVGRGSGDGVLKPYDPGYKPEPHEVCLLDLSDQPEVASTIADISDVASIELFTAEEEVIDGLRFYAVVIGSATRRAVFLRSYNRKKELSRRGGFALMLRGGSYNQVRDKVFLFDEQIDCFAWDGSIYILNVTQFHRIFEYFEQIKARADQTLRRITKRIPVSNLEEFREACRGNSLMASKLASIARKTYFDRVGMSDVRRTIEEFKLGIEIVKEDGQDKLIFDPSREGRWLILKLLDDDFLGSVMTREKYEVNSKTRR